MSRTSVVALLGLGLAITSAPAHGGSRKPDPAPQAKHDPRAVQLHLEAMAHFVARRYRAAIVLFEKAYAIEPHPNTLYSIGEAYRRLGEQQRSYHYYSLYAATLSGAQRVAFAAKLRTLRTLHSAPPTSLPTKAPRAVLRAARHRAPPARAESAANTQLVLSKRPRARRKSHLAFVLGFSVGPMLSSFGDERLELSAGVAIGAEAGISWSLSRRLAFETHVAVYFNSLRDAVADDSASFVSFAASIGLHVSLGSRLFVAARVALGPSLLIGAASDSFLLDRPGADASAVLVGLLVRPALALGLRLWRGLELSLAPAVDVSPRLGGFDALAPTITRITRYQLALTLSWRR